MVASANCGRCVVAPHGGSTPWSVPIRHQANFLSSLDLHDPPIVYGQLYRTEPKALDRGEDLAGHVRFHGPAPAIRSILSICLVDYSTTLLCARGNSPAPSTRRTLSRTEP
jgi:hypothetical protein